MNYGGELTYAIYAMMYSTIAAGHWLGLRIAIIPYWKTQQITVRKSSNQRPKLP
jgi:hypothetical protein